MKVIFHKIIYIMAGALCLIASSCADDFPYSYSDIPEGEGTLSATVTFTPITAANLGSTRANGNVLNYINSLCVLVYTPDGNLYKSYSSKSTDTEKKLTYTIGEYTVNKDKDHFDGNEAHTDEEKTAKATFSLQNLSYGKYRLYAVANMDDLLEKYQENIQTEEGLKTISLTWDPQNIPANNQMFGYFTPATNMEAKGFNAPTISFDKPETSIHAWLKRAASKVTVAFDPSGLRQGVNVYIRNVTIRDIPKTCFLGAENTPTSIGELDNHLNTPYPKPDFTKTSDAIANTRFEYNSDGLITDPDVHTGSSKTDGFELTNHIRNAVPKDAHGTASPSLFFFENNQQPDYENMTPEQKKRYDKRQQHSGEDDGVGKPVRDDEEKDEEGNVIKTDLDFKDRIPYGTYIEVEAYYISTNPAKVGEGSIKYRFMLGKDAEFDYNAQRNYHYKVTLGFNGWANDPDWHIDYELPSPGLEVQPVFRVSYLYHQKSELPIRILGNCTDLKVEITENNWAPYDPTSRNAYQVPDAVTADDPNPTYEFKWNSTAFSNPEYMENGKPVCYFGFLALHMPDINETTTIKTSFSSTANTELKNHYISTKEGERTFSGSELDLGSHTGTPSEDNYEVNIVKNDLGTEIPNQKTLMLPVWTRAKTLISESGFSGNNPYEGYERRAKLKITATFDGGTENEKIIEKEVTVLQVKRLVNPKGVWRANDRTKAFNVTLLEAENANGMSNFQPFTSDGEWTAYIDAQTNDAGFSLSTNSKTDGYIENGVIHGYTGSTINFTINFGAAVGEDESQCAIVKVLYHGNQCLHKILIRKGYNNPIRMGGRLWSSFSLYQATWLRGDRDGYNDEYNAVLTANPLMLGSMFRRGIQSKGILVKNNMDANLAPFLPPNGVSFQVANATTPLQTWEEIGYRNDVLAANRDKSLGIFYAGGRTYKVPTYDDWVALTNDAEFGYGVVYGSEADEPALTSEEAYGLIDPDNEGKFDSKMGMRGIIAYKKESGDQIFFPMGKYGTGRRTQFNVQRIPAPTPSNPDATIANQNYFGVLRYADVYEPLTLSSNPENLYRPIPYNLPISCGNIYWIDVYEGGVRDIPNSESYYGEGCLGWDLNYFNFDFNAYTANNYADACPIKFIVVE